MAKLFPPIVDSKLPAFGVHVNSKEKVYMEVPFMMNRAVSEKDFTAMAILIKTVQTNTIIAEITDGQYDSTTNVAKFDITDTIISRKITPGQFYKVQLAYANGKDIGYYSSIGLIKCTTYPSVIVENYGNGYYGSFEFVGKCSWEESGQDVTEKVYSYSFSLLDNENNIIATSGEQLHNSSTDVNTKYSTDTWFLNKNLIEGVEYKLIYSIKTINGLNYSSQSYPITQSESIDPNLPCQLIAKQDYEDGCIQLFLRPIADRTMTGMYLISRSNSKNDYSTWDEIYRFQYRGVEMKARDAGLPEYKWDINDILLWEDFTVEQGVSYIYSIQAYNSNGLYSSRLKNKRETLKYDENDFWKMTMFEEEEVQADFEDAFLFDGKIQLKIRFNPKVSSFKSTVLESKVDTIGGKYPFIFRNGNVNYKEFPISGLISLLSDPNERFFRDIQNEVILRQQTSLSNSEINKIKISDLNTNLTTDNFYKERQFKLKVLDWLTNGEPKLFRSPGEGNFIVRLMNTSLTPNDTLSRMLHSFQTTAYEIADLTFENLNAYGFISSPEGHFKSYAMAEIKIADSEYLNGNRFKIPAVGGGYAVSITDATPGTILMLDYLDNENSNSYEIGDTGTYIVPLRDKKVYYVDLISGNWDDAKVSYWYYSIDPIDNFSIISKITGEQVIKQVIGFDYPQSDSEYGTLNLVGKGFKPNPDIPTLKKMVDIRREVGYFNEIKVSQRALKLCLFNSGTNKYYEYKEHSRGPEITDWGETNIYVVYDYSTERFLGYIYNINTKAIVNKKPNFDFKLNDNPKIDFAGNNNIYLLETEPGYNPPQTYGAMASYKNIDKVDKLYVGNGLILDLVYREKQLEYSFEKNHQEIVDAKDQYSKASTVSEKEATYEEYVKAIEEVYQQEWEDFYG